MITTVQAKSPTVWTKKSTSTTQSKNHLDRLLKPINSARAHIQPKLMSTIKTTSSDRSASKRSVSSHRSKNQDSQFEVQHDNLMSRQQFRTNTHRSVSRTRVVPKEVNATGSIYGTQSYDSGYSHISRKSEAIPIPLTIQRPQGPTGAGSNQHMQNVQIIIAGMSNCNPFLRPNLNWNSPNSHSFFQRNQ